MQRIVQSESQLVFRSNRLNLGYTMDSSSCFDCQRLSYVIVVYLQKKFVSN